MRPELESIYQTAPIGLAVLDTQLRFLRVNERLAEMNGVPVEAHLGRTVAEVLPDLATQAEAMLRRVLETGEPIRDLEIRGHTPAQPGVERVWIEQITPLRDERGGITRLSIVAEEVTERRRAELALRQSEETLALAMEAAGLAVWEWHIPGNRLRFTATWEQILGYQPDELAGTGVGWQAIMHPRDRDATEACMAAHVEGRAPVYECEYRLRHADGHWVWIASRGRVVERDGDGHPLRMIGVGRDVTAQRQARVELQRQAQLLQSAFDAIFTWTEQGGIEFWNHGAELQYGFSAAEAVGTPPDVLLHTRFSRAREDIVKALTDEGVWRGELSHQTKDGRRLTVTAVLQRLGTGVRVMEVTRDVTEAKAAEARLLERERELRRSQERLQVALDAGHMGVWDWTPGADTGFWSPEVYKLLGLPHAPDEPAQFHRFLQMVHPGDRMRLDAEMARVLAKGGDYEAEFRVVRTDGEVRWLVSRGRVSHDNDGLRSRMVGVNFDITERKLIEQALTEADARRNEFLAMLAHELRNPLAPISNAVRLLEKVGDIPQRRQAATQILRRQTAHMARLVDDLLEVSRITQGRIELRMENVLVAASVSQAVEASRPQARERQQVITVDVPPALDLVADPARLTQVISNLVANAVKYTQEGGEIDVKVEADSEQWLSIVVADNGPGIAPELLPRIFDLFTQDRRTLDRSQGGLGIGLALVKRLVELHGGHVRAESPGQGGGSRFIVCLPRQGRREELRRSPADAAAHVAPLPMLVVDDNRDAADSLVSLLRLDGHRVAAAYDGQQALEAARELRPKVVLLDLGLPGLDGLEVARRLRADGHFERTVLIAMSGYAQRTDREATAAAGFDAHLAKPVDLAGIYSEIEAKLK